MKLKILSLAVLFLGFTVSLPHAFATEKAGFIVTMVAASNEGNDIGLDNDDYRDELIQLFSYTTYKQLDLKKIYLTQGAKTSLELPDGYELSAQMPGLEKDVASLKVNISKDQKEFVNTTLSIRSGGVTFVGGPPTEEGVLILIIERP